VFQKLCKKDVQGSKDATRPSPTSKPVSAHRLSQHQTQQPSTAVTQQPSSGADQTPPPGAPDIPQTSSAVPQTSAADNDDVQHSSSKSDSAGKRHESYNVINSPCLVKTDLKEFVVGRREQIAKVLANNPERAGSTSERQPYKWPTRTYASQVGGSLTKLAVGEDNGQRACGSAFRVNKKKSK
jgi:hypothetical protein